ncbi:hypothetical protein KDW_57520 [Dictyobacter vulcani]|uniref:Haloacid dehalogenase n=1 Tax=Dictyobacter vulcani TaxID=2607529 RepID=A0A5J4KYI5_9CHLR|nr:HAD family hydrolase [Dictyobacter vulcani]GER91590.1 hypothetical protein KDW_57520 [Dictyobacter vulcani]
MPKLVFWIDVDNTLLDNDGIKDKQNEFLQAELGPELTKLYWDIYEEVREERSVVDIPLALERLRERVPQDKLDEQTYQHTLSMFHNYPFAQALYPHAIETVHYLSSLGTVVIVSDGDLVYQAEKIFNSNLAEAVEGHVMLFVHKQEHLDEIRQRYPADHWTVIDDKPQILFDIKKLMGDDVTTVFVRQGKYARESFPENYTPDMDINHIGDLQKYPGKRFWQQHDIASS